MTTPLDVAAWSPWLRDRSASVAPATEARVVTFPATALVSRVQIALGADPSADPATWAWADITSYVRFDPGITVSTGRRDEASQVSTGSATMRLDNRDGRFTRRNPNSPYYGLLSKNTPIWVTVDAGSGEKTRLEMFVNEWPTRWSDKSATDSTVTIRCAGILRRLAQGKVLKSPPRRYIPTTSPVAYWSLEDGPLALVGAPDVGSFPIRPFVGTHPSGGVVTYPRFGSGELAPWLPSVVNRSGSEDLTILYGFVSMPAFTSGWTVDLYYASGLDGATNAIDVNPGYLAGGTTVWSQMILTPTANALEVAMNGEPEVPGTPGTLFDGNVHHIRWSVAQSGANVSWTVSVDGTVANSGTTSGAMTLTAMTSIGLTAEEGTGSSIAIGHVGVWTTPPTLATAVLVAQGYAGEQAHARMTRICREEGIAFYSAATTSSLMGPQSSEQPIAIIRECETADGGVLYEKRWGLAYQSLAERYNQPVGLALDVNQGHLADIPEPADDDQRIRNLITVSRTYGSEVTAEQTTGPMGTGSQGPGVYDDSATLNVQADTQLLDQASWRLHLATVDEDRWPDIGLDLARNPGLIDTWCGLGYGARVTVANPVAPVFDPPNVIIEGYAERWNTKAWRASLNCSPASPYQVAIVEDSTSIQDVPRVGSSTAILAVGISSSDVSLSVTTGAGGLWTTLAADFPLDINVGGERIRLSSISGAASPQTFTVSARSINTITKSHLAGASVEVWKIALVGL